MMMIIKLIEFSSIQTINPVVSTIAFIRDDHRHGCKNSQICRHFISGWSKVQFIKTILEYLSF